MDVQSEVSGDAHNSTNTKRQVRQKSALSQCAGSSTFFFQRRKGIEGRERELASVKKCPIRFVSLPVNNTLTPSDMYTQRLFAHTEHVLRTDTMLRCRPSRTGFASKQQRYTGKDCMHSVTNLEKKTLASSSNASVDDASAADSTPYRTRSLPSRIVLHVPYPFSHVVRPSQR